MQSAEPWFSVEDIAEHLGVSKETVYRWLEKGKIPSHRVGKLWKFRASEVDEWVLAGRAAESVPDKGRDVEKAKRNTKSGKRLKQ